MDSRHCVLEKGKCILESKVSPFNTYYEIQFLEYTTCYVRVAQAAEKVQVEELTDRQNQGNLKSSVYCVFSALKSYFRLYVDLFFLWYQLKQVLWRQSLQLTRYRFQGLSSISLTLAFSSLCCTLQQAVVCTIVTEHDTKCIIGSLASSLPGGIVGLLLVDLLNSKAAPYM